MSMSDDPGTDPIDDLKDIDNLSKRVSERAGRAADSRGGTFAIDDDGEPGGEDDSGPSAS
jgi:hypothetical protein